MTSVFDPTIRYALFDELDRHDGPVLSMHAQDRLVNLVEIVEHEYAGSLEPIALSTLAIGREALRWLVFREDDGSRFVEVCRFDAQLRVSG